MVLVLISQREHKNDERSSFPIKKHIQKKMGQERKVFIAYPATLKYLDENGQENTVRNEEFKKMKSEMEVKGAFDGKFIPARGLSNSAQPNSNTPARE